MVCVPVNSDLCNDVKGGAVIESLQCLHVCLCGAAGSVHVIYIFTLLI